MGKGTDMASARHVFVRILQAVGVILAAMVLAGLTVNALYPDRWQAVPATVESTAIEQVRYGTLEWALQVQAAYEVSGERYETRQDMFRNPDLDVVEAEAANWPAGRVFMLYADAAHPAAVSRAPDGGREALVVTAVILTPLLLGLIALIVFVIRRARQP